MGHLLPLRDGANRRFLRALALAASVSASGSVLCAQAVYTDRDFGGDSALAPCDVSHLHDERPGLGDRISAVDIPAGWTFVLFENTNFQGGELSLPGPLRVRSLEDHRFSNGSRVEDEVSSIRVLAPPARPSTRSVFPARRTHAEVLNGETDSLPVARPGGPADAGTPISFVDSLSYLPSGDDDFGFSIQEQQGGYSFSAFDGNGESRVSFFINSWLLPPPVRVVDRSILELRGRRDRKTHDVLVPPGHRSMAVIEVLSYVPKDDDLMWASRASRTGDSVRFAAISDHGSQDSSIRLRATVLAWPGPARSTPTSILHAGGTTNGLIASKPPDATHLLDQHPVFLAIPTSYVTDLWRYDLNAFNDRDPAPFLEAYASERPGRPDREEDDDYEFEIRQCQHILHVRSRNGNRYSQTEVSVWLPDFSQ